MRNGIGFASKFLCFYLGETSEYPAINMHILSMLLNEENRNKKNLGICKLVAGYSEV